MHQLNSNRHPMTVSPRSASRASSTEEARRLVRRCAVPCSAGDSVKVLLGRSSDRLQLPFNRVRDIWYGEARRIEAGEMDRLRKVADQTELARAVAGIEIAIKRLEKLQSVDAIASLKTALDALMQPNCLPLTAFPVLSIAESR